VGLSFGRGRREGGYLVGEVIHIDRFGNVITNIPKDLALELADWGEELEVSAGEAGERVCLRLLSTYGLAEEGELILLIGSHGLVELAESWGSAAARLGLHPGDGVRIERRWAGRHRHG